MTTHPEPRILGFLRWLEATRGLRFEATTPAGWLTPGMPVRKMVVMSLRGAAGTCTPG